MPVHVDGCYWILQVVEKVTPKVHIYDSLGIRQPNRRYGAAFYLVLKYNETMQSGGEDRGWLMYGRSSETLRQINWYD